MGGPVFPRSDSPATPTRRNQALSAFPRNGHSWVSACDQSAKKESMPPGGWTEASNWHSVGPCETLQEHSEATGGPPDTYMRNAKSDAFCSGYTKAKVPYVNMIED